MDTKREERRPIPVGEADARAVEETARRAGELALRYFHARAELAVGEKGHLDLVTQADVEVERYLTESLRRLFPQDGVYGEEGDHIARASGRLWMIDPIDGTVNYVRGGQDSPVSVGLYEGREPVFGVVYVPVSGQLFSGGRSVPSRQNGQEMKRVPAFTVSKGSVELGVHPSVPTDKRVELLRFVSDELRAAFRCCGSATVSLLKVATGEADGYLALGDATWDVMAAMAILRNLGAGSTIDWKRTRLPDKLWYACGGEAFLQETRSFVMGLR